MKVLRILYIFCFLLPSISYAQPIWQSNLDSKIEFYQSSDFGIILAGSKRSLYAIDEKTGETIWRRKHSGLDETSISTIPDTDLILLSLDEGDRSRLEAIDILSGEAIWRSEKVKGDVMQIAADPTGDLLCVVLAKKAKGKAGQEFKRTPKIHMLSLEGGKELWKEELDSDIEMMPAEFTPGKEIPFTLDNYRPPLILDGKLYLFYEGSTIFDARSGKEIERDKFKVNESGLALTEADAIFDEKNLYLSGRGKIRAIDRRSGKIAWKADDLGTTAEMALIGNTLYIRTGGQFTRLKDGESEQKGPFGISAIDAGSGKTLWRFKGADKGLTNFIFRDEKTILLADKDDLISLDALNGKRTAKAPHKIEKAQFIILNEKREAVIGGKDTLAAFDAGFQRVWSARHKAPSRGVFRMISGIALRATALYFRYGGLAASGYGLARNGLSLFKSISSLRSNFLKNRFGAFDLSSLAANYARSYVSNQIRLFGIASRIQNFQGLQIQRPNLLNRLAPTRADLQESLLDRLDPARLAERLSDYLLKRKRLAELRGNHMFFYTDLPKPFDKKGLIGVNLNTGEDSRFILLSEPDPRFITDDINGLLYSAEGNRLTAYDLLER